MSMGQLWLGYASAEGRDKVMQVMRARDPRAQVRLAGSPVELRERFLLGDLNQVGCVVGLTSEGVSDMNLAAAIASDGKAREVAVVVSHASGSLRSRAARAGIDEVIDAHEYATEPVRSLVPASSAGRAVISSAGGERTGEGVGAQERLMRLAQLPGEDLEEPDGVRFAANAPTSASTLSVVPAQAEEASEVAAPRVQAAAHLAPIVASPARAEMPRVGVPIKAGSYRVRSGDRAPMIVLASGRGGVGKTALCATMAAVAGSWGMRVGLLDLDLGSGNLYSCFGLPRGCDLSRLSSAESYADDDIRRIGLHCCAGVTLWGPCDRPEMAETVMPVTAQLVETVRGDSDVVIVDTSTTCTDAVAQAIQSCDRLALVHDEQAGGVSSLARMSALAVRLGCARTRILRIANHADPHGRVDLFDGRAEVGLESARVYRVCDGGYEVEELLREGHATELVEERLDFREDVAGMLAQVLQELGKLPDNEDARYALETSGKPRRRGLLARLREA